MQSYNAYTGGMKCYKVIRSPCWELITFHEVPRTPGTAMIVRHSMKGHDISKSK